MKNILSLFRNPGRAKAELIMLATQISRMFLGISIIFIFASNNPVNAQCFIDAGPAKDTFSGCSTQLKASTGAYYFTFDNGNQGWSKAIAGITCTGKTSTLTWDTSSFGYQGKGMGCPNNGEKGPENSYIVSPTLTLGGKVTITFNSWSNNESGYPCMYDVEFVEISTDGGKTWTTLNGGMVTGLNNVYNDAQWRTISMTTEIDPSKNALVRFRYDTGDGCCGGTGSHNGWFVDNIKISCGAVKWYPEEGLSCTDCLTPTVSGIFGTKKYYVTVVGAYGCNAIDSIEVTATGTKQYYRDFDGDGYGDVYHAKATCNGQPAGYVTLPGDCNDSNALTKLELSEIRIFGNGSEIYSNETAVSSLTGTDFGTYESQKTVFHSFRVQNAGSSPLKTYSITIEGPDASAFKVLNKTGIIVAGSYEDFNVEFAPEHGGFSKAWLVVHTNDCDERFFRFMVSGRVKCNENHAQPDVPGIYVSKFAETSANGNTCFCDGSGSLLLSIKYTDEGTKLADTMISVHIFPNYPELDTAPYDPAKTNMIAYARMNRTWSLRTNDETIAPFVVRYYFSIADIKTINSAFRGGDFEQITDPIQVKFYTITNPDITDWDKLSALTREDYTILNNDDNLSDSTWVFGNMGEGRYYGEVQVNGNTYGGGAGGYIAYTEIPVELVSLTAEATGNDINIHWSMASESGITKYQVYRSTDGNNYSFLADVAVDLQPAQVKNYSYTDESAPKGITCYYKIKAVEINGTTHLFGPAYARLKTDAVQAGVFPVPTAGILHLETGKEETPVHFELLNYLGKVVQTGSMEMGSGELDITLLPAGNYFLKVNSEGEIRTFKVTKI